MSSNKDISNSTRNYIEKTAESYKYQYDPYLNIDNLLSMHRDLIKQSSYEGGNRCWNILNTI